MTGVGCWKVVVTQNTTPHHAFSIKTKCFCLVNFAEGCCAEGAGGKARVRNERENGLAAKRTETGQQNGTERGH